LGHSEQEFKCGKILLQCNTATRQFPYRCKHCVKLSDSHVTHAIWFCEKTANIRQDLICEIYFALGTRPFQLFIGIPLLAQCRQLALITTRLENGIFANPKLLSLLFKLRL